MKSAIAILFSLVFSFSALTGQIVWKSDKSHSGVNFSVSHMVVAEVTGGFKDFDATLTVTQDDFSDMTIEANIKAASIDTKNENRDNHLRAGDFFDAEKFPDITFKSTKVETDGEGNFKITGDLTIRDVTKSVMLDTRLKGTVTDNRGNLKAGFKATTTIDRFDYGILWNKTLDSGGLIVGKNVDITLLFEFNKINPENGSK